MARQPRQQPIGFYGKFQPTGADDSAARRMQALAGLAGQVGGMAEKFGIAKAEELAPAEALQAVEEARIVDPETGKVSYGEVAQKSGWGSSVYQNTVINAQYAQRKTDTTIRLNEIAVDFADDPEGYETAAKAFYDATVDAAPIEIRQDLRSAMGPRISSNFQTINANFVANSEKQGQAILQDSINTALIDLENLTANGEDQLVAEELPLLYLTIDAMGEADPLYDVEGAKNKVNNVLYEQRTLKTLNDIADKDGVGAAMTALEEFQDKPLPKGMSQADLKSFTVSAQQGLNRKNSRINASAKVATKEAQKQTQDYIIARSLGQPINEQERSAVYELAKGTPLEEKLFLADEIGIFATASMQARNDMLDAARGGGLDRVDAYKAMLIANEDINRKAREDGISMYVAQGLGEAIEFNPSILVDDPATPEDELALNQQAFIDREEQAKLASEHYGVPVSPLTTAEANALSNTITQMTPVDKMGLVNLFGSDSSVWGQIAGNNQGVFAQAAASGDLVVQQTIFKGQDLLANKLVTKLKDTDGYLSQFNKMVAGVYGPNDKRDTLDTVLNYYYGSLDEGESTYNSSKFEAAVQAVTGGIGEIRGHQTQLPRGVTADALDLYFSTLTVADLENAGIESTIITKDKIIPVGRSAFEAGARPESKTITNNLTLNAIHNGRIKAIAGQGNYVMYDPDGKVIVDKNGKPAMFNVTQQTIKDAANRAEEIAIEQAGSYVDYRIQRMQTPSQLAQTFRDL